MIALAQISIGPRLVPVSVCRNTSEVNMYAAFGSWWSEVLLIHFLNRHLVAGGQSLVISPHRP